MNTTSKRLSKELVEASKSQDRDILIQTDGDSLHKWVGYIRGPPDSPFEKGWFKLEYVIGVNYP